MQRIEAFGHLAAAEFEQDVFPRLVITEECDRDVRGFEQLAVILTAAFGDDVESAAASAMAARPSSSAFHLRIGRATSRRTSAWGRRPNFLPQPQGFGATARRGSLIDGRANASSDSTASWLVLPFRMAPDQKLPRSPLSPSPPGASTASSDTEKPKLSGQSGVQASVSTAALDRGMLMAATSPPSFSAAVSGPDSDAEIMLRAKAGDQPAFDYLVQKYRRPIVGFMYRMARNAAVAEDLAQEVFLRVYRSRASYEASAKFTTWLYRIATNLAVNHARDTRHERPEVTVSLDEPDEESGTTLELPDATLTAEQSMVRRERMMAIRSKVEALPEQQRLAVIMHKYQQMDYKQIAEVLKKSESATKSLLFRAYETLREQLKEFV